MRRHSFTSDLARRGLSLAGIAGLTLLALWCGTNSLTRSGIMNTAKADDRFATAFERAKLAANASTGRAFHSSLGDEGVMPDLDGATGWLNSPVLSRQSLRGKVVLMNFWTFTCINSLRPMPYLRDWAARYGAKDFVVIGVHTPEFSFEHELRNVQDSVHTLNVPFPVAVDSKYRIWQAFNNQYWPAQYLIDVKGRVRHHHANIAGSGEDSWYA